VSKSMAVTAMVSVTRTRALSIVPVELSVCTRLCSPHSCQSATPPLAGRHRGARGTANRTVDARTWSPIVIRLYACHMSSDSSGTSVTTPEPSRSSRRLSCRIVAPHRAQPPPPHKAEQQQCPARRRRRRGSRKHGREVDRAGGRQHGGCGGGGGAAAWYVPAFRCAEESLGLTSASQRRLCMSTSGLRVRRWRLTKARGRSRGRQPRSLCLARTPPMAWRACGVCGGPCGCARACAPCGMRGWTDPAGTRSRSPATGRASPTPLATTPLAPW
jgi:hypothetical protein